MDSYARGRKARIHGQPRPFSHKGHNKDFLKGWVDQDREITANPSETEKEPTMADVIEKTPEDLAWLAGITDRQADQPFDANPYTPERERVAWQKGWRLADAVAEQGAS